MSAVDVDLAKRAVETAVADGADDAEAYATEERRREVRVYDGRTESLTAASQRGVGIRAWIGSRVGYGFGTDLSPEGLAQIARRAVGAARVADPDGFAGPPTPAGEPPAVDGLSDPSVGQWDTADAVELALSVERAATEVDPRVTGGEGVVYVDDAGRVAIAVSTGIAAEFEASSAYAYLFALANGEGGQQPGLGFGAARGPAGLDPRVIGTEAGERAVAMIGASKPSSRSCPVVLDSTVAASFISLLGHMACADAVQRGRSPLAERLGEEVASGAFVLHDDGLDPEGFASAPVDGEGVSQRRTALIEDGRLQTFLYDTYSARRGDVESTGNAGRSGYRAAPSLAPSNLVVASGSHSFEDLLGEAGEGICINQVFGLHAGVNLVSGTFSVGAFGREIRGGELAEPLSEFTIAGDLVSMLRTVRAVGEDPRWVPLEGSVSTPPMLIGEMTIGGS